MAEPIDFTALAEQAKKGLTPAYIRGLLKALRKMPSRAERIAADLGRPDPRDFIRDVLGERPTKAAVEFGFTDIWTPDQERILVSVMENQKTAVPSGHGTGKDWIAARVVLWFLYRKPNSIVVTTAPTLRQVEIVLWGEIREARKNSKTPLPGEGTLTQLKLGDKWLAIGFTTRPGVSDISATSFQGLHAENVLVVYDEAVGLDPLILEAGQSLALRPTDRHLAIANPTDPSSWFRKACETWNCVRMSCENHPNVIHGNADIVPGAVSREWVADKLEEYGSRESPLFQAKVLGLFPEEKADTLIRLAWVERAQRVEADEKDDGLGTVLGLDIAGEGEDLTVLWACKNRRFFVPTLRGKPAWHVGKDTMQAVALVRLALDELPNVRAIALDDTGIGGGVRARLREIQRSGGLPQYHAGNLKQMAIGHDVRIIPVNFGSPAYDKDRFYKRVDELFWHLREALEPHTEGSARGDQVYLPDQEEIDSYGFPKKHSMVAQLTRCTYAFPSGKIEVYDKKGRHNKAEATKHLPDQSPDIAHALILCNWARIDQRPREKAQPARTTQEIFDRQIREELDRAHKRRRRPERRLPPWRRMNR